MKNLLSKTLLCSVLATSFLLINCQKAPNRDAKAPIVPPAKPTAKVGVCTADIAKDYEELKASDKKIQDKLVSIKETDPSKVSEADKAALDELAKGHNELSKKVMDAILKLKVEACAVHEANDPKKKQIDMAAIIKIKGVRSNAGKAIKAKTGRDNVITSEDAKEAAETLKEGQELKIVSIDLARVLSKKDSSGGAVAIVDSAVVDGKAAKDALDDVNKTACSLDITKDEDIKVNSIVKITGLGNVIQDEKTKRNVMEIKIEAKNDAGTGSVLLGLKCNIPEAQKDEAAKEVRKALNALVSSVEKAAGDPAKVTPEDMAKLEKAAADADKELTAAKTELDKATVDAKTARAAADAAKEDPAKQDAAKAADATAATAKTNADAAQAKADAAKKALEEAKKK